VKSDEACDKLARILEPSPLLNDHVALFAQIDQLPDITECVRTQLVDASNKADWGRFERYVLAAWRRPARSLAQPLCDVLGRHSDEVNNEDIVEALGEIRDPGSVHCLVDALWWQPEWDEFHGLAIKCIRALANIATSHAREALQHAAAAGPEEVGSEARRLLAKMGA
jgi:hypothetical protein